MTKYILILACLLFLTTAGHAATYYVCGATGSPCNASDSNAGTSKTATWLHAPGMTNCTATCNSTTINAGDSIIFRGGDTWHYGASTVPAVGGSWVFGFSGTATHCNYNANDVSTCIYIGVDQTWFSGGSWTRPLLTGDNPLSSALVASCTFDNTATQFFSDISNSYITFDNFEIGYYCWSGTGGKGNVTSPGPNNNSFTNLYVHGWSSTTGSTDDKHIVGPGANFSTANNNVWAFDVFDGGDALTGNTNCTGVSNPCRSGYLFGGQSYDLHDSVVKDISNGFVVVQEYSVHDNLFINLIPTYDGATHPNGFESNSSQPAGLPMYFYNNVFYQIQSVGVGWWPEPVAGPTGIGLMYFNNVEYLMNPGNCYMYDRGSSGTPNVNVYFNNNTTVSPCAFNIYDAHTAPGGTASFENNHFIGTYTTIPSFIIGNGSATVTVTDNGHHVFQTQAAAAAQGYVQGSNTLSSNWFAPSAGTNATVGAGTNATAFCNTITDATISAACKVGMAGISYNTTNHTVTALVGNARPSSGAWDAGAYQFSSGGGASFTCTPSTVPANHSTHISLTCTGSGTAWTGSTAFTVGGATFVSKTNNSATSETVVITTGGPGTATITDTTDSISTTIAIATATLSISPTSGATITAPTLALSAFNTLWSADIAAGNFTASTLFSVSGASCVGDSLGAASGITLTAASAVLTTGTSVCTATITDNSTTATATFTVTVPSPCGGSASLVQHTFTTACVGNGVLTTCTVTPPSASVAGHLAEITAWFSGTTGASSTGITGISGNSHGAVGWNACPGHSCFSAVGTPATGCNAGFCSQDIYYNPSIVGGDTSFTVTLGVPPPTFFEVEYSEWILPGTGGAQYDASGGVADSTACTTCNGVTLSLRGTQDIIFQTQNASQVCTTISSPYVAIDTTTGSQYGGILGALTDTTSGAAPTYACTSGTTPVSALALAECSAAGPPHAPPSPALNMLTLTEKEKRENTRFISSLLFGN